MGAFANVKGLSFYRDNNEDPYITFKEVNILI
jgi:periodic tryptophan protein 1